ncbi:hypothetical protein CDAR_117931 [Caerostris darwini]|uniref:Uncharacterized protein n=1 Tax=Caerostris darwini TaxID=1538125 RepID=A0AAV4PZX3_9ARAC|nr:hypothetical protein CDAR_117931 [Caerostris darwini]
MKSIPLVTGNVKRERVIVVSVGNTILGKGCGTSEIATDLNATLGTRNVTGESSAIYVSAHERFGPPVTTRTRTSIDAVFSTHSVRTCGLHDSVFSHPLRIPSVIRSCPLGKNKTRYGRSTRRRRSKAGPDPWNFEAHIDREGDDDGYPM